MLIAAFNLNAWARQQPTAERLEERQANVIRLPEPNLPASLVLGCGPVGPGSPPPPAKPPTEAGLFKSRKFGKESEDEGLNWSQNVSSKINILCLINGLSNLRRRDRRRTKFREPPRRDQPTTLMTSRVGHWDERGEGHAE